MAAKRGPTLRAQWLGKQLRELRDTAGLTLKDAAAFIERDQSTVSRFESGEYPIRRSQLLALLDLYHVDEQVRRDVLLKLGDEVWHTGWWDGFAGHIADWSIDYAWVEERAHTIHMYDVSIVPGLLQSRDYAETVISSADPLAPAERIEHGVEFRRNRQEILDREDPPQLRVVLDEGVLYRVIGDKQVLQDQLEYLANMSRRPNIEVRVLTFAAETHASPDGAFKLLELPEPYHDVGYMDTPAGALYVEANDVKRLARTYDRLWKAAAGAAESTELITAVAQRLA